MIETRVTKLLGIRYPVLQGGMAWVADAGLAAAVSEAGGLGIIAAASMPPELLREEIRKVKTLTKNPFGVNIMLMSPYAAEVAEVCIQEEVPVVTTGAGNPGKFIPAWKAAGIKVVPVVPSARLALRVQRAGADAVVCEGCEAGGHIGELTTMCLVPQVRDTVEIPVIAAGGIADPRGFVAALTLGADGVQIGTAFLCAEESPAHPNYKQAVVDAGDTDTAVTGRGNGHPVRSLKNKFLRQVMEMEKNEVPFEELEEKTLGSLRSAVQEGNPETGSFMAGQIAGMITAVKPAAEIIRELMEGSVKLLQNSMEGRDVTIG